MTWLQHTPATVPTGCEVHTPFDIGCRLCRAYRPELVEARFDADREKIAEYRKAWTDEKAEADEYLKQTLALREKIAALEVEGRELQQLRESAERLLKERGRG